MVRTAGSRLTETGVVSRTVGELTITLLPARGYETRHVAERASLGVAIEMQHGVDAIASDRVRPFFARPYTLAWLPAGCEVYSRSSAGGEYLKIEGVAGPTGTDPFNGRSVSGTREAVRKVRLWLLYGGPGDATPPALALLLAFGGGNATLGDAGCGPGALDDRRLRRVLELVETRLEEPLTVPALAESVGLGADHFARAFSQALGCTPHRYVMERRLERARNALRGADARLADIALACGFSSHAHLTRTFRAQYGRTPGSVRGTGCSVPTTSGSKRGRS